MPSVAWRHLAENLRSSLEIPAQQSAAAHWHVNTSTTTTARPLHNNNDNYYEYHGHNYDRYPSDYYYYYDYEDYDENKGVYHSSQRTTLRVSTTTPEASQGRE